MTLLPFDIETARFAVIAGTGRIVTREGFLVEVIRWENERDSSWPIIGIIYFPEDLSATESWTGKGKYSYMKENHKYDLFIETDFDL